MDYSMLTPFECSTKLQDYRQGVLMA